MDYTPILTGEEKAWLTEHGAIRMGFLTSDSGVSTYNPSTGEITGTITDYIQFAKDCLGNQELVFQMVGYDSKEAELGALKSGEIDMVFHFDQSPNLAEEYRVACTNTKYSLQGTTQGRYLTGGVPPVRLSTSFSISLSTWASSTCRAAIFGFAFAAFFLPVSVL